MGPEHRLRAFFPRSARLAGAQREFRKLRNRQAARRVISVKHPNDPELLGTPQETVTMMSRIEEIVSESNRMREREREQLNQRYHVAQLVAAMRSRLVPQVQGSSTSSVSGQARYIDEAA